MTTDEKLAAILAAIQTDPGNRGLARDPHDNLFTATKGDFEAACRSIAETRHPILQLFTGFFIPTGEPPAFETDGPLGIAFLCRTLLPLGISAWIITEQRCWRSLTSAFAEIDGGPVDLWANDLDPNSLATIHRESVHTPASAVISHTISVERVGPSADGRCYSMRGLDVTERLNRSFPALYSVSCPGATIGIGDGGNEIGMGKIPHETIVKNIPNGDLIHCRVPTDHLIVCGVSNWGAYALAAGVYVLRGVKPPSDLFDPDRERAILEVMVREGPLVDGVTGKQTATVDGLSWDEYTKPLIRIREILEG
jgi:hypothetical protein